MGDRTSFYLTYEFGRWWLFRRGDRFAIGEYDTPERAQRALRAALKGA